MPSTRGQFVPVIHHEQCSGPATLDLSKRTEQCPPLVVNSSESPTTSRSIRSTRIHQRRIGAHRVAKRTPLPLRGPSPLSSRVANLDDRKVGVAFEILDLDR
jgi:hypothetical protein